ncbi:hypothetical protein CTZ27_37090 [Streptomyces griseocarneus]|nr:hypothetical protein CTZ27_37090 [Streptomyces griseocarneus]
MFVRRGTYEDLRARHSDLLGERWRLQRLAAELETKLITEVSERRREQGLLRDAQDITRACEEENRQLRKALKLARESSSSETSELRKELEKRRPRPAPPGGRELHLAQQALRTMTRHVEELTAANDAMCRELYDRHGAQARPGGHDAGGQT